MLSILIFHFIQNKHLHMPNKYKRWFSTISPALSYRKSAVVTTVRENVIVTIEQKKKETIHYTKFSCTYAAIHWFWLLCVLNDVFLSLRLRLRLWFTKNMEWNESEWSEVEWSETYLFLAFPFFIRYIQFYLRYYQQMRNISLLWRFNFTILAHEKSDVAEKCWKIVLMDWKSLCLQPENMKSTENLRNEKKTTHTHTYIHTLTHTCLSFFSRGEPLKMNDKIQWNLKIATR